MNRIATAIAGVALPLAALAAGAMLGCRPVPGSAAGAVAPAAGRQTVITEEEIAWMSVRTAWDVVRLRSPRLTAAQDASGRPTGIRIQERQSVNADETPLLVVDGMQVLDIDYLSQIPAFDLHAIRILTSEVAQPLYGLRAAGGAIVVETKQRN